MPNWYNPDDDEPDDSPFFRREPPHPPRKKIQGGIKENGGVFQAPLCPVEGCNALMVKRHGPHGPFWGCSKWPDCDGRPDSGDEDAMDWNAWSDLVDW